MTFSRIKYDTDTYAYKWKSYRRSKIWALAPEDISSCVPVKCIEQFYQISEDVEFGHLVLRSRSFLVLVSFWQKMHVKYLHQNSKDGYSR